MYPPENISSNNRPVVNLEDRELEKMSMEEIRKHNPQYWKMISDTVYERQKDKDGFFKSSISDFKSKNKLEFQIDHIIPRKDGGLTTLDNLQLLNRWEHAKKTAKEKFQSFLNKNPKG